MGDSDLYQWLFRRAPVMVTSIGENGRYLDISDAFATRLGYPRDEILGCLPDDFMTPDSAERATREFRPALRRTGKLERKPVSFIAQSGERVDCVANAIVELDPNDVFVRTVATYQEISDEAKTNFKYRDLYRSTPAMLHIVDAEGRLVTVTDHWLQKLGYERHEVIGRPVIEFYSDADRERWSGGKLKELINAGDFNNLERQMMTRDGQVLDLEMSAIAHRGADGTVQQMLVASKDLTAHKAAERELRQALADNARLREELERERDYLREEVNVAMNFGRIVGSSPALKRMLQRVEAVAETPASVLLLGESGVGKELVARALHAQGPRAEGPLVKVNCASIPKELFESEFFGHVKGAFTGAHRDRIGRFQLADGGTIFLDEVGEIPLELQGKLLRVLQESEFERVGDDETKRVDVRVIAATNRNLVDLIRSGEFREDLYYRLSVFPIDVPPLRERGEDVVQLAQDFLEQTCLEFGRERLSLTRAQADVLLQYDWPGNVRELKNVIERAVILSTGNTLRLEASMPGSNKRRLKTDVRTSGEDIMTEAQLNSLKRRNTIRALEAAGWRVSGKGGAAELLGVRPTTLADRIRSMQIEKPSARAQ